MLAPLLFGVTFEELLSSYEIVHDKVQCPRLQSLGNVQISEEVIKDGQTGRLVPMGAGRYPKHWARFLSVDSHHSTDTFVGRSLEFAKQL
jgi:hypothetical protein